MDNFKIELFEKENSKKFPIYQTLSEFESLLFLNKLAEKYNINSSNFAVELLGRQSFHSNFEEFELKETLTNLGIKPLNKILINWNKFQSLDIFGTDDLDKYFDNIWYSSADDIDLFDESLDWIVSISHYGAITFIINR